MSACNAAASCADACGSGTGAKRDAHRGGLRRASQNAFRAVASVRWCGSDHGGKLNAQAFFFLFLDDDPRRDHHHQALGFAADADVLEQAVDVGKLAQDRHAELVAAFAQALDAAQQHRAAVGHADRGGHRDEREVRQLHRDAVVVVVGLVVRRMSNRRSSRRCFRFRRCSWWSSSSR